MTDARRRCISAMIAITVGACARDATTRTTRTRRVTLAPASATLEPGGVEGFGAAGPTADGLGTRAPGVVTYAATGGTITPDGRYTAGRTPGTFHVVATVRTAQAIIAETALVTVLPPGVHRYTTKFPRSERPISEGGRWITGGAVGLDWTDVSTTAGLAVGHQVGPSYTDATAILTGRWEPDQTAWATVHTTNQNDDCFQEVELRLRSVVAAHVNRGYEVSYKCSRTKVAYLIIVRWDGPVAKFTYLYNQSGARFGLRDGDVVRASISGDVITAYKNGEQMAQVRDDTFTSGSPGMGFNLVSSAPGCAGTNGDYGYTRYTAMDFVVTSAAARRTRPVRTASPRNRRRRAGVGTATAGSARHAQRGRNRRTSLPQRRAANST
jgi:hypothetical protein